MSHGKSSRSGSVRQSSQETGRSGGEAQAVPGRPFSLPPGYYEFYGLRPPESVPAVQAKRSVVGPSHPNSRSVLEYYGIVPPATSDSAVSLAQERKAVQTEGAASRMHTSSLDAGLRQRAEDSLGTDLSGVRVHQGPDAVAMNAEMNARAFTRGQDIVLGADVGNDANPILAHEIAHTVQQRGAVATFAKKAELERVGAA